MLGVLAKQCGGCVAGIEREGEEERMGVLEDRGNEGIDHVGTSRPV